MDGTGKWLVRGSEEASALRASGWLHAGAHGDLVYLIPLDHNDAATIAWLNRATSTLQQRERVGLSYSGDASEAFSDALGNMSDWYVRITPREGDAFDAVVVRSGLNVEIDGDTWYDAVTYLPADPETGLAIEGAAAQTVRVVDVYVY